MKPRRGSKVPERGKEHRALVDALSYLSGLRGASNPDVDLDAAMLIERLSEQGFVIVAKPDLARGRYSPEELRSRRDALGLSLKAVAREAGLTEDAVRRAEQPGSRSHRATVDGVAEALNRLAAE